MGSGTFGGIYFGQYAMDTTVEDVVITLSGGDFTLDGTKWMPIDGTAWGPIDGTRWGIVA